jgi:MAE_28990/MAE_18760-like HEPN
VSKLRTVQQLQDCLDEGFAWRLKEVADLKVSTRRNTSLAQATLLRAGVPLLYAHWEGFVKQSSQDYLTFVANQRLSYGELSSCFVVFGAKKHLANLVQARRADVNIAAVEFFRTCLVDRADLALSGVVNTEHNLNANVFANIAVSVGVATDPYEPYFNLIDESLVARRNKIAHGEHLDLNANDFRLLADNVINLLRMYKTNLENLASTEAFRANTVSRLPGA